MAIDTIKAQAIFDGTVSTADLADDAVTSAKILDDAVTTAKILDGNITVTKLASSGTLPALDGSNLTGVDPADGSITTAKLADDAVTSAKLSVASTNINTGYIKSKHTGVNATNDMTGDYDHTDVTHSGGTGLIVDMGTPNSASSTYILSGDAQAYPDGAAQRAVDAGAYFGIGFMRKIGTGSWTAIRDQGRWGQGNGVDDDQNNRVELSYRDHPNTTEQVQYKLVFSTHRGGCYWGRQPTGQEGGNTNLYVSEYDTGETS